MQHHLRCPHNCYVLPLGHPILLWVMRCPQLPFNSFCYTKVLKLLRDILSTIVTSQCPNLLSWFFLNQGFELKRPWEGLILLLREIDPTSMRKIINENNLVPLFSGGGCREWSTHICMNLLQDCFSSTISILKGRFCILTQGTTFACVHLFKFTFGKSSRNLLIIFKAPWCKWPNLLCHNSPISWLYTNSDLELNAA